MAGTGILIDEDFGLNDRYRVVLRAFRVAASKKFPQGVKAKFVLIDVGTKAARLLVDNHEPFGFHMHTELPEDKATRVELDVKDHNEALDVFFGEVERILKNERE
jgi:hypothetical protein